jgi:hypothetical protein
MTAANGCVLGASISENADKTGLEKAYGQFKTEARQLNPNYQPLTVTTDAWEATCSAWKSLFSGITLILCFLHEVLKIRNVCRSKASLCHTLTQKLWFIYHASNKREFAQRLRRFLAWVKQSQVAESIAQKLRRIRTKSHLYQAAFDFPDAYRTSNQVDRPMNYFDRILYSMQYFHGSLSSAQLTVRSMAILWNFHPFCRKARSNKQGVLSPFEALNGFRYHDNWLRNFLIASSLNGRRTLFFDKHKLVRN